MVIQQIFCHLLKLFFSLIFHPKCQKKTFHFLTSPHICALFIVKQLSLILFIPYLKMTESTKRSLRARRPPAYLLPDPEDQDQSGYPRQGFSREFVSPAQELNNIAKLLSKFVNSANKRIKETSKIDGSEMRANEEQMSQYNAKEAKKMEKVNQMGSKKVQQKEVIKDDGAKVGKNLPPKSTNTQQGINKVLNTNQDKVTRSAIKNKTDGIPSNIFNSQNNLGGNYSSKVLQQQPNLNNQNTTRASFYPDQQTFVQNPLLLKNKIESNREALKKNGQNANKVFGRASYHIGIAYHIHLKNLEQNGKNLNDLNAADPTLPARRLKGEQEHQQ